MAWTADPAFVASLDAANQSSGFFEPGWRVVEADGVDGLAVTNGNLTLWINRQQHLSDEDRQCSAGDEVSVRFPKAWRTVGPGQYRVVSDQYWHYEPGNCVRVYFRLNPMGAPALVKEVSDGLNRQEIAFRLKILSNPSLYLWRRDSAVLYVRPEDFESVSMVLREGLPRLEQWLRPDIPAFCKPLQPGVALAGDPPLGPSGVESFGQNRSRLVAEGLAFAGLEGLRGSRGRLGRIVRRFEDEGIDLSRPWLNPGSTKDYHWTEACNRDGSL
jgi:hypothetical protein